jgi:SPP1 gp7 family putative phage head morphogenesis protein
MLKRISKNLLRLEGRLLEALRDSELRQIRKEMQAEMEELFRLQGYLFLRKFAGYKSEFLQESFTDADVQKLWGMVALQTQEKLIKIVTKATSRAVEKGYNRLAKAVGWGIELSFNLKNPRAVEFLRNNAALKVTAVNDTTRKEIARIVTKGTEEGLSYQKMEREIKSKFAEFSERKPQLHIANRAELVAVTETANAYEAGNQVFAKDLQDRGLRVIKAWSTVGDDRVSDGCEENESAGWIPENDAFPSGDAHPPRFPGCRCTCLYDTIVEVTA